MGFSSGSKPLQQSPSTKPNPKPCLIWICERRSLTGGILTPALGTPVPTGTVRTRQPKDATTPAESRGKKIRSGGKCVRIKSQGYTKRQRDTQKEKEKERESKNPNTLSNFALNEAAKTFHERNRAMPVIRASISCPPSPHPPRWT